MLKVAALATDVAVEIVVTIKIVRVIDLDVTAIPIAITPVPVPATPSAPSRSTQRDSRTPR
jgi:hypothetical protein